MNINTVKMRTDYKFSINELKECELRKKLADNWLPDLLSNGDPIRGAAVLEVGYVDIEINIHTICQMTSDENKNQDYTPVVSYFVCKKTEEDWISDDYLSGDVKIDWMAENWMELLERDMFEKLDAYVTEKGLSYDNPN